MPILTNEYLVYLHRELKELEALAANCPDDRREALDTLDVIAQRLERTAARLLLIAS